MRILMLNYEYPPLGGGGGVAAANLARELVRRGHLVDYVTTLFEGAARAESLAGVRLYRERVWKRDARDTATIASMLSYPPAAIWRGHRLARSNAYDLIHTHFAIPTGPAGAVLSRWLRRPNVLSVYGGDIYDPSKPYSPHANPLLKRVVRSVLGQADLVVPESTDLARRAAEIYGTRSEIQVVPLGFAPPEFEKCSREELGLQPEKTYAISVSRLVARKAHADLLHALRRADVDELELLLVGSGPEESALQRLALELGIAAKVHFLGHQKEARKFQYLSVADFFVLATLHEGFGIVFQEAMYCGLPIATTNVGGQTDFLKHGENALLSAPGDREGMAESLRSLASERSLRERMGLENRRAIRGHSVEETAGRYLDLYQGQVAARR